MNIHTYAIDFGTSNSLLVPVGDQGPLPPVPLDPAAERPEVFRSILYFDQSRHIHYGAAAIQRYSQESMNGRLIRSFKRFLPTKSFESTVIVGRTWKLEDLVATFLREMRERADAHLGAKVTRVVFGRPALYAEEPENDLLAETRMRRAAEAAGFETIEFLPEPIAAAYRYRKEIVKPETVLVADFGGGTSDYTLIRISKQDFKREDVLSVGGAPVAGDALDGAIMRKKVVKHFGGEVQYQVPFGDNILKMPTSLMSYLCSTAHIQLLNSRENRDFLSRVKSWSLGREDEDRMEQLETLLDQQLGFAVFESIERAKRGLSDSELSKIQYEYPGISIDEPMTRSEFKTIASNETDRIFTALDDTLNRAGISADQVSRVCLTGGTAKATVVRAELERRFGKDKLEEFRHFTSIAEGLAEYAAEQ